MCSARACDYHFRDECTICRTLTTQALSAGKPVACRNLGQCLSTERFCVYTFYQIWALMIRHQHSQYLVVSAPAQRRSCTILASSRIHRRVAPPAAAFSASRTPWSAGARGALRFSTPSPRSSSLASTPPVRKSGQSSFSLSFDPKSSSSVAGTPCFSSRARGNEISPFNPRNLYKTGGKSSRPVQWNTRGPA